MAGVRLVGHRRTPCGGLRKRIAVLLQHRHGLVDGGCGLLILHEVLAPALGLSLVFAWRGSSSSRVHQGVDLLQALPELGQLRLGELRMSQLAQGRAAECLAVLLEQDVGNRDTRRVAVCRRLLQEDKRSNLGEAALVVASRIFDGVSDLSGRGPQARGRGGDLREGDLALQLLGSCLDVVAGAGRRALVGVAPGRLPRSVLLR
mmetsp:Transcript_39218/g.106127  ORF Transcript_39218/g.106127 Transcript_39218/m.106127 type:complete len:204 (-) Transcript_39218:752-1363(-)